MARRIDDSHHTFKRAGGIGPALGKQCPHGPGAVVRKLRSAQDGGRLKYGVYVNTSCKVY